MSTTTEVRYIRKKLLHEILLEVSKWDHGQSHPLEIPGYSNEEIAHHIEYLYEEGLIHARAIFSKEGAHYSPRALTVQGHETLNDWNKKFNNH